jgi:hypothetical protein
MTNRNQYIYIPVIENVNGVVYCYRVFKSLKTKKYYIQSKDNVSLDVIYLEQQNSQLIELFTEISPIEREKGYRTIKKAIKKFNEDFN